MNKVTIHPITPAGNVAPPETSVAEPVPGKPDSGKTSYVYCSSYPSNVQGFSSSHQDDNGNRTSIFGSAGRIDLGQTLTIASAGKGYHQGEKVQVVGFNAQGNCMGCIVIVKAGDKSVAAFHPSYFSEFKDNPKL